MGSLIICIGICISIICCSNPRESGVSDTIGIIWHSGQSCNDDVKRIIVDSTLERIVILAAILEGVKSFLSGDTGFNAAIYMSVTDQITLE